MYSDLNISVFDFYGKEMENINFENKNKIGVMNSISLNTTNFPAGVYILQIDNGGDKSTAKFVVEK